MWLITVAQKKNYYQIVRMPPQLHFSGFRWTQILGIPEKRYLNVLRIPLQILSCM